MLPVASEDADGRGGVTAGLYVTDPSLLCALSVILGFFFPVLPKLTQQIRSAVLRRRF